MPPNEATDISRRPALPDHPQQMAADVEDEEKDPVVDSGPGIDDGVDPKPKAPPSSDDEGRTIVPVKLPGQPHAPERV